MSLRYPPVSPSPALAHRRLSAPPGLYVRVWVRPRASNLCCEDVTHRAFISNPGVEDSLFLKIYLCVCYIYDYLPPCMYVYHMHAWCPQSPEDGITPLDLELQARVSCHVGWVSRSSPASYCRAPLWL